MLADAGGFGGAGSTKVPLGCSPARRATSHVGGPAFCSSHFLVIVKFSRTVDAQGFDSPSDLRVEEHHAAIGE